MQAASPSISKSVSYNRLVELEREVAVPLTLFIKKVLLGKRNTKLTAAPGNTIANGASTIIIPFRNYR